MTLRFRIMTGYCKVGFHDSEWPPDVTNDGFRRTAVILCCMGTPAPPNGPTWFFEFLGWVICSSWPDPMQVTWNLLRSTNTISPFRGVDMQFSNVFLSKERFRYLYCSPRWKLWTRSFDFYGKQLGRSTIEPPPRYQGNSLCLHVFFIAFSLAKITSASDQFMQKCFKISH